MRYSDGKTYKGYVVNDDGSFTLPALAINMMDARVRAMQRARQEFESGLKTLGDDLNIDISKFNYSPEGGVLRPK